MISVVWPGDPAVTQPYGCTSLTVEPYYAACPSKHKHCGIDVGLVVGTPLAAAEDSTVAYIGTALLALVGASGCWWYVHIDRVAAGISVGKPLAREQLACYSGNKVPSGGSSTGPHLHLELQDATKAILAYYDANGRLIKPPGCLNNPATSLDPVPTLQGRFSSGGGSITPPERKRMYFLKDSQSRVFAIYQVTRGTVKDLLSADAWAAYSAAGATAGSDPNDVLVNKIPYVGFPDALQDEVDKIAGMLSTVGSSTSDIKAAIANLKVASGGLTPEQGEQLHAIELVVQQLEQQFAGGLNISGTAKPA